MPINLTTECLFTSLMYKIKVIGGIYDFNTTPVPFLYPQLWDNRAELQPEAPPPTTSYLGYFTLLWTSAPSLSSP